MGDCSLQPGTPACVPCSRLRRIIACWLAEAPGGVTPLSTLCLNTVFAGVFSFSGDELHCSGAGHSASSSSSILEQFALRKSVAPLWRVAAAARRRAERRPAAELQTLVSTVYCASRSLKQLCGYVIGSATRCGVAPRNDMRLSTSTPRRDVSQVLDVLSVTC